MRLVRVILCRLPHGGSLKLAAFAVFAGPAHTLRVPRLTY